jgi:FtsP/CotA-like multicopper oxidase with cupredoxin domain
VEPGTYLYQSGSQSAVQVPMGLYGAMTKDHDDAPRQAYAGIGYDSEVLLLFSEIDPDLNAAVVSGAYGTAAYPSTIRYAPKYFLVNGVPYQEGAAPVPAGDVGESVLLSFLNAGLKTHVPVLQGTHVALVAEDGKPYPYQRQQYSVFLPAAKTVDAILQPASAVVIPVYDRRLDVANPAAGGQEPGGMMAFLAVGAVAPGNTPPSVTSTAATTATAGQPYSYQVTAQDAEGGPLTFALDVAPAGMGIDAGGLIGWTPGPGDAGDHPVTVRVQDAGGLSGTQSFVVSVASVNVAPTAQGESYSVAQGGSLTVPAPGVLGNDDDADGDALSASLVSGPANGTLNLNANGGFTYTPAGTFTGTVSFQYRAYDGALYSDPVTVQITVAVNQAPVAVYDIVTVKRNVSSVINMLANDYDPDGEIDPTTVIITTGSTRGAGIVVNADGTVTYTPRRNFTGTDTFRYRVRDNLGKLSNVTTVRVSVVR